MHPSPTLPSTTKFTTPQQAANDDDSEEDSVFGDDSDESDDSDEEEENDGRPVLKGRAKWLKKVVTAPKKPSAAAVQAAKDKEKEKEKKKDDKRAKASAATSEEKKWFDEDITDEALDKKVNEIVSSRGRKHTDPREVLRKLEVLAKVARILGPKKEIPVLMHLVSAMYDSHRVIDDYMELPEWRTCYRCLTRIISLLDANRDIKLGLMPALDVTDLVLGSQVKTDFALKKKDEAEEPEEEKDDGTLKVVGSLDTFLGRLEDEYTKSLQQINPHSQVNPNVYRQLES